MDIRDAEKILQDIEGVCKANNDDPLVVVANGNKLIPVKRVIAVDNVFNVCTAIGDDDDSITLSNMMAGFETIDFDYIKIDFDKEVKSIKIDLIGNFMYIIMEVE